MLSSSSFRGILRPPQAQSAVHRSLVAHHPPHIARRFMSSSAPSNMHDNDPTRSPTIPVIRDLPSLRRWRQQVRSSGRTVGIVPTMGALHAGHLSLVQASKASTNQATVVTVFVNPTQFAPHEDLDAYPRTMERDLELLQNLRRDSDGLGGEIVVFAPDRHTMYPLSSLQGPTIGADEGGEGMLQDTSKQRGAFVEVKGWGDVLEGKSRPQFFRGVATVCTKLFNAVEPDHAYFGQKDIQQALILQIMLKDLLTSYPNSENLHIIPTSRDADGLALSSRNAYLTAEERPHAPVLYEALTRARQALMDAQASGSDIAGREVVDIAQKVIDEYVARTGAPIRPIYVELFDRESFQSIEDSMITSGGEIRKAVLSGAMWLGKTRLIDNLLIGWGVEP